MKKLTLALDTLQVQSFNTAADEEAQAGTVRGMGTGLQDTDCSAVDACPSGRGCTQIGGCDTSTCETYDPEQCPSVVDACPTGRGCTPVFPC